MKFRLTFDKDMKTTVEEILKNEQEQFVLKFHKSKTMNIRSWIARRKYGIKIEPQFEYIFISDTGAEVTIETGIDWLADKKRLLRSWKQYETASRGEIQVELVKEDT